MDKERGVVNYGKWFKRESVLIETERQIEERRESPHPTEHSGWVFRCPSEPSEPGDTDMDHGQQDEGGHYRFSLMLQVSRAQISARIGIERNMLDVRGLGRDVFGLHFVSHLSPNKSYETEVRNI